MNEDGHAAEQKTAKVGYGFGQTSPYTATLTNDHAISLVRVRISSETKNANERDLLIRIVSRR